MASMNAMPMHQMHPALAYGHHPMMQFGLTDMTGGYPGVHGLSSDPAKLGQHFTDRYAGLQ